MPVTAAAAAPGGPERRDPGHALLVAARAARRPRAHRLDALRRAGVHDRAGQPVASTPRPMKGGVQGVAPGHAEADVFEAPQVVFTPSSSRSSCRVSKNSRDGARLGADRHRQGVDDDVLGRDAVVAGGRDDLLRDLDPVARAPSGSRRRSRGRSRPRRTSATIGRISSSRSSSPVTELTSALPSYTDEPGLERLDTDESMHSGRSVSPCTSGTAWRISSTSSASGSPTLTSSTSRAARTCSATSISSCAEVARLQLRLERLAPGRVDALADDAERPVRADHDGLMTATENCLHCLPLLAGWDAEALAQACDAARRGGSR